jgi:hypothetical protein
MRNRFIAGLFITTAALFFVAPVSAEESISQSRSITADIEEIQSMIQRSQNRQGIVQETQEAESEPGAPISGKIVEPSPVSTVTEQVPAATSPESVQSSAKVPDKSTFHNHSAQSTTPATPVPSTVSANQAKVTKGGTPKFSTNCCQAC